MIILHFDNVEMLAKDPDLRPTFSVLKNQLKDMESQHKVTQTESTY